MIQNVFDAIFKFFRYTAKNEQISSTCRSSLGFARHLVISYLALGAKSQ